MKQGYESVQLKTRIRNESSFLSELKDNKTAYLMALPGIILLILFCYIPYYYIMIAFKDYNFQQGVFGSPWVGWRNFEFFFAQGGKALVTTSNTLILNTMFITANVITQVGLAILINEIRNRYLKNISQSFFFFPFFLSWVVIGEIIYNIFSSDYGSMNRLVSIFGLQPVEWYKHPEYWRAILVMANIWKTAGYGAIVYLAAMNGFDNSYYEAAVVDGANRLQCIFRITIPMLKPTMFILVLFAVGRIFFGDFGMVYGVVRDIGPLLSKVEVIDTYVYRAFRQSGDIGMATAIGLYQSVFGFVLIVITNKLAKRFNDGSALF